MKVKDAFMVFLEEQTFLNSPRQKNVLLQLEPRENAAMKSISHSIDWAVPSPRGGDTKQKWLNSRLEEFTPIKDLTCCFKMLNNSIFFDMLR